MRGVVGAISSTEVPEGKPAAAFKRQGRVRKEIASTFDVPRLVLGFNGVRSGDPDFYPLQVIGGLLTSGKTGRLYRQLVEGEELASAVDRTNNAGRYPGSFETQLELLQ